MGALWSACLILGATHVLNPDAFIVKTNSVLMEQGRAFDAAYNSRLSDDALPVLVETFPYMNPQDQEVVVIRLGARFCRMQDEGDLRSWNLSRMVAASLLNSNKAFVDRLGGCESGLINPRRLEPTD